MVVVAGDRSGTQTADCTLSQSQSVALRNPAVTQPYPRPPVGVGRYLDPGRVETAGADGAWIQRGFREFDELE